MPDTFWVLEATGSGQWYWTGHGPRTCDPDIQCAIKFTSRRDAERVAKLMAPDEVAFVFVAVEHGVVAS
jgi:hypothetical protein